MTFPASIQSQLNQSWNLGQFTEGEIWTMRDAAVDVDKMLVVVSAPFDWKLV